MRSFSVSRPSKFANVVGFLPFHRDWKIVPLSFLMILFQRNNSQMLVKLARGWEKIYLFPQRAEKECAITSF